MDTPTITSTLATAFAASIALCACGEVDANEPNDNSSSPARPATFELEDSQKTPAAAAQGAQSEADKDREFDAIDGHSEPIVITRTGGDEVRVGAEHTYQISVHNTAAVPLHDVVIHEHFSSEFEILRFAETPVDSSQRAQQVSAGSQSERSSRRADRKNYSWELGMLQPGEARTFEVTAIARQEGELGACMTVDYKPAFCSMITVVNPSLELESTLAQTEREAYYACEEIPITFTLRNTGTGATDGIIVRGSLPEGLTTAEGESEMAFELDSLEAGEEVQRVVNLTPAAPGRYRVRARAASGELEVNGPTQEIRVLQPELTVRVDGPGQGYVDRPMTFTVTVENTSNDLAADTALRLFLPEGARKVSYSTRNFDAEAGQLAIGELGGGERRSFEVTFENDDPSEFEVAAVATALCVDEVRGAAQSRSVGIPAALIEVVDRKDPVPVGETTVYNVFVKNQGTAADLDLTVSGVLPEGFEFVSASGASEITADGRGLTFAPVAELQPGDVVAWEIQARATTAGKGRFRVELASQANDRPVIEIEPTTSY